VYCVYVCGVCMRVGMFGVCVMYVCVVCVVCAFVLYACVWRHVLCVCGGVYFVCVY
jgi:hypothetical protein